MKTPAVEFYRVAEVAALLGVSDQSVRNYADDLRQILTPGAVPGPGVERRFSVLDVRVLVLVRDAKREGLKPDQVTERVQVALASRDYADLPPMPVVEESPDEQHMEMAIVQARAAWAAERNGFEDTIRRLEADKRDLEAKLQAERQRGEDKVEREQEGRRADLERLMREIADLRAQLAAGSGSSALATSVQPPAAPPPAADDRPRGRWPWSR
jgi:DNA-binding transcriptional MerR regulator